VVLSTTKKLALTLIASIAVTGAFGVAQTPPAAPAADAKPQKVAKDQAEVDLITSIGKDTDPAHKLKLLDQWTHDYPETAFAAERTQEYLFTYIAMKDCKNQSKVASTILKTDANNELSLRTIIGCIYQIKSPDASDLDTAEKASTYLIANADAVYADSNNATKVPAAQWQGLKPTMVAAAKHTIPYIDIQRKDDAKAEADLTKLLQADPTDAQSSLMLAGVLFGERAAKPEKLPPAIFEYARAGVYAGPNSLPATNRQQNLTAATKIYTQYHGSNEGWDKVAALANTNALPPDGWTIESTTEIAIRKQKEDEERDKADPVGTVWRTIHDGLTGDMDTAFWESVKDAGLPGEGRKFKGKLVSMKPAIGNPKTLLINVKDPTGAADVTLTLEMPLRGKMDAGAELEFEGVAAAYIKSPYMLTLKIDDNKAQIIGWKPVAAPPTPKKAAPAAKKQP
jgi:hypothetical protein